jgi:hypothetical protein
MSTTPEVATKAPAVDREEMRRALHLLVEPGQVTELRILTGYRPIGGYFSDPEALIAAAGRYAANAKGVYITLNPVHPSILVRAINRVREIPKGESTHNHEITSIRWLPIDVDPVRATGISATDEEHELALGKAREIIRDLAEIGFPLVPLFADSGNGAWILYRVDLRPDETELVSRVLHALADQFNDDDRVKIDMSVSRAAQLAKLPGSWARKGDPSQDRPHRMARIIEAPETLEDFEIIPREELERFASSIRRRGSPSRPDHNGVRFESLDLERWVSRYAPDAKGPTPWSGGPRLWTFAACPWRASDDGQTAFVAEMESGAITAACQHDTCPGSRSTGNHWRELREMLEPGARQRREDWEQRQYSSNGTNGSSPPPRDNPPPPGDADAPPEGEPVTVKTFEVYDAADMPEWECPEVRWLIKDILPADCIAYDHALPKTFKSWRALDMFYCLALGIPWLGRFETEKSRSLIVCNDDRLRRIKSRLTEIVIGHGKGPAPRGSLVFLPVRDQKELRNRSFDLPSDEDLEAIIKRGKDFDVIAFDMIAYAMGDLDEDKKADFTKFAKLLRLVQDSTGAAIYGIEHDRKGLANPKLRSAEPDPNEMRGSGSKFGLVDVLVSTRRPNDDRRVIVRIESRDHDEVILLGVQIAPKDSAPGVPKITAFDLQAAAELQKAKGNDNKARVLEALKNGPATLKKIRENIAAKYPDEEPTIAETTIQGHLCHLMDEHKVSRSGKPHSGGYKYELTGTPNTTHEMDFASRESAASAYEDNDFD